MSAYHFSNKSKKTNHPVRAALYNPQQKCMKFMNILKYSFIYLCNTLCQVWRLECVCYSVYKDTGIDMSITVCTEAANFSTNGPRCSAAFSPSWKKLRTHNRSV